jgi:hypothetical protein
LANKEYTSIIRLFNHCDISINDDFNLSRARKQLQAEFGIAQDGFIEIEGYTYTRHINLHYPFPSSRLTGKILQEGGKTGRVRGQYNQAIVILYPLQKIGDLLVSIFIMRVSYTGPFTKKRICFVKE